MKASEKMWWIKLAAAIVIGIFCFIMQLYFSVSGSSAFMIGVLLYVIISDLLARRNGMDQVRGLKIGIGVFLFTWVMVWALLNTVIQTMV
jgi:hypothetical protein